MRVLLQTSLEFGKCLPAYGILVCVRQQAVGLKYPSQMFWCTEINLQKWEELGIQETQWSSVTWHLALSGDVRPHLRQKTCTLEIKSNFSPVLALLDTNIVSGQAASSSGERGGLLLFIQTKEMVPHSRMHFQQKQCNSGTVEKLYSLDNLMRVDTGNNDSI